MNSKFVAIGLIALCTGLVGGYILFNAQVQVNPSHVMSEASAMSGTMNGMTAELVGKTGDAFDQAFIQNMIVHHEGAVAMARQALAHAQHQEIKVLAREIISAQAKEIETMRGWLVDWYGN